MRYARFEKNNTVACGIIEGDTIKLIAGEILDGGAPTGETVALDTVKLLPPVIPETFYAAGLNYVAHIMEQAEAGERNQIFLKSPTSAIAPTTR